MTTNNLQTALAEAVRCAEEFARAARRLQEQLESLFGSAPPVARPSEPPPSGKRTRRSHEEIERVQFAIIEELKKHPDGVGLEALRRVLPEDKRTIQMALNFGKEHGVIIQSGERRGTKYSLKKTSTAQATGRVVKRKAKG